MSEKNFRIVSILVLLFCLVLIRFYEHTIFNDPFIAFFKQDFISQHTPSFDILELVIQTSFRYVLNSLLSIAILYLTFKKTNVLRFSILFYTAVFVVLISVFVILSNNLTQESHLYFFYVRRFLIQPIFLLLLWPAFYYQEFLRKN